MNGLGVVGHSIALGTVIRHRNRIGGKLEGVGSLIEILVVFYVEAVAEPQGSLPRHLGKNSKLIGQSGGIFISQGDSIHDHLSPSSHRDGALTHRPLACGEILLVGHGGGVESQNAALIGSQRLGTHENALEGDGLGHGISGEGDIPTAYLPNRLLLFKGIAVDDQLALALSGKGELRHAAVAPRRCRQIEIVGMRLSVLRQLYPYTVQFLVVPRVGGGGVVQRRMGGGGLVFDDHEHGVAQRHDHVVDRVRIVGEHRGSQAGIALQPHHQCAPLIGNRTALHRIEVRLTAHLAQGVQHVAVGHRDLHLLHLPAGIKGTSLQGHADGGKPHFQRREEARSLGHVANRGKAVCRSVGGNLAPQGHTTEHALPLALGEHEARHLGKTLPLGGRERDLHGWSSVFQDKSGQAADGLGGLIYESTTHVILGQGPIIGRVGVIGLTNLLVGVLGLDKVLHGGIPFRSKIFVRFCSRDLIRNPRYATRRANPGRPSLRQSGRGARRSRLPWYWPAPEWE